MDVWLFCETSCGEEIKRRRRRRKKHKSNSCHGLFPAISFCLTHYFSSVFLTPPESLSIKTAVTFPLTDAAALVSVPRDVWKRNDTLITSEFIKINSQNDLTWTQGQIDFSGFGLVLLQEIFSILHLIEIPAVTKRQAVSLHTLTETV